jgi:hypothetical protein
VNEVQMRAARFRANLSPSRPSCRCDTASIHRIAEGQT